MFKYRPYRCQACGSEKEILTENDNPCLDFCNQCSVHPDRYTDNAFVFSAIGSTRTLRPFECIESWIDMDIQLHEDVIERSPLFTGMSPWQVKRVVMLGENRDFREGEVIVTQGQSDRFTYVLLTGSARVVVVNDSGDEVEVNKIGIGEVFGEVASILGMSRTANVIAETRTRVFSVDAAAIERIGRFYPRLAYYITRNSARVLGLRFRGVNAELAEWKQIEDGAGDSDQDDDSLTPDQ